MGSGWGEHPNPLYVNLYGIAQLPESLWEETLKVKIKYGNSGRIIPSVSLGMPDVGLMVRVVGLGSYGPEFKSCLAVELIPGGVDSACHPSEVGKMTTSLLGWLSHSSILRWSGDLTLAPAHKHVQINTPKVFSLLLFEKTSWCLFLLLPPLFLNLPLWVPKLLAVSVPLAFSNSLGSLKFKMIFPDLLVHCAIG